MNALGNYYIANYWSEDDYTTIGHIPRRCEAHASIETVKRARCGVLECLAGNWLDLRTGKRAEARGDQGVSDDRGGQNWGQVIHGGT